MTTSNDAGDVKDAVQKKYADIARKNDRECCGADSGSGDTGSMIDDEYDDVAGYVSDADLGLGCGLPTDDAGIELGHDVLDLGSGAGLDAFVARSLVGETGTVVGVDVTPEMVDKARANADELGYDNVTFHQGDIEALPLESASFDVVISNCVLNLVPDKATAFAEMHRVLRPGGHFVVSDIVTHGSLPASVQRSAELYAGCVAGAMEQEAYLKLLRGAGFQDVDIIRDKEIQIPDDVLLESASQAELDTFRDAGGALVSITVRGARP